MQHQMYAMQASSYTTIATKRAVLKCAANLSTSAHFELTCGSVLHFGTFAQEMVSNSENWSPVAQACTLSRRVKCKKTRFKALDVANQRSS
jgi:hypothetical protein